MQRRPIANRQAVDFPYAAHAAQRNRRNMAAILSSIEQMKRNTALLDSTPGLLLQAVVIPGERTTEGQVIEAVALPWFEIIRLVQRNPEQIYQIDWRKWEEIIAGAYTRQGFDVILTPRSNDR